MSFLLSHANEDGLVKIMKWQIGDALSMPMNLVKRDLQSLQEQDRLKLVMRSKQKGEGNTY